MVDKIEEDIRKAAKDETDKILLKNVDEYDSVTAAITSTTKQAVQKRRTKIRERLEKSKAIMDYQDIRESMKEDKQRTGRETPEVTEDGDHEKIILRDPYKCPECKCFSLTLHPPESCLDHQGVEQVPTSRKKKKPFYSTKKRAKLF